MLTKELFRILTLFLTHMVLKNNLMDYQIGTQTMNLKE